MARTCDRMFRSGAACRWLASDPA